MFYIVSIILALFILITIFFVNVNFLIYIAIALFILHIIFTKSIFMTIKKLLHLIPYFLAIFIIQAFNSRGEYYNVFGFYIDKVGADFTIIYFIRIASVLYFLSIFFIIIKKYNILFTSHRASVYNTINVVIIHKPYVFSKNLSGHIINSRILTYRLGYFRMKLL